MNEYDKFAEREGITLVAEASSLLTIGSGMAPGHRLWQCTLSRPVKGETSPRTMAFLLPGAPGSTGPTAGEALELVSEDAAVFDDIGETVEDWARGMRHEAVTPEVETSYKAAGDQYNQLLHLVGDGLIEELLWETIQNGQQS